MKRLSVLLVIGTLACAQAPPDAVEQQAILNRIRETARRYQEQLPDFVCVMLTKRSEDSSGTGKHLKQRDTEEVEFSYIGHHPYRKVLKINGKPASAEIPNGFHSDYALQLVGFLPDWLFGAEAKTQFTWNRWDMSGGSRAAVFNLRLLAADSKLPLSDDRGLWSVGLHGLMYADPATGQILRLELQLDISPSFHREIQSSSLDLDYGPVLIGDQEFFLPIRAVARLRTPRASLKTRRR